MALFGPSREEKILSYLDGLSNGLISAVRPEKVSYSAKENAIEGENGFKLVYIEGDSGIGMGLSTNYNSPIGNIALHLVAMIPIPKENFEKEFLRKDVLDEFLIRQNESSSGSLESMVSDKTEKSKMSRTGQSVVFMVETFRDGSHYSLTIESNKGLFLYNDLELRGEGSFRGFSEEIEIEDIIATLDGSLAAQLAYQKIDREKARRMTAEQLEMELAKSALKFLPPDMKVKEIGLEDELVMLVAEDDNGKLCFKKEFGVGNFSYEIQGDYENKAEHLKAYGCSSVAVKDGKTTLRGNPLLITQLGQELTGKNSKGLLS